MKALFMMFAAAVGLSLSAGAFAADSATGEALIKSSGCTACHSVDKKLVGPAFKDVAAKYKNNKDAEAALVKKVKTGGKGNWGEMPMPPNMHVKDSDIQTIVHWILSLK